MNAFVTGFARADSAPLPTTARIEAYIASHAFDHPTLVLDTQIVASQYRALKAGLGDTHVHYAVKANPHPRIIETLVNEGSRFDAASRGEIELCLSQGAEPGQISFGNTIKRASDIAFAWNAGITLFAADAEEELDKLAANAPGANVYIRLLVEHSEADWPLFNTLRDWRSERAKQDGVPSYVISNNRQPAEVVKARPATLAALGAIEGFGDAKLKKYGQELLALIAGEPPPEPEPGDAKA